jgi:hypothetical protein
MIFGRHRQDRRCGIVLIDLIFYVSLLAVVLILMAVVFDQFLRQTGQLRRNISDIERAMQAGERWRADVRKATGDLVIENDSATIPQAKGQVVYSLGSVVKRRGANSEIWETALTGVKASRMEAERRAHASGWRWDIELESRRKNAKVRPLFTFMAVPEALNEN